MEEDIGGRYWTKILEEDMSSSSSSSSLAGPMSLANTTIRSDDGNLEDIDSYSLMSNSMLSNVFSNSMFSASNSNGKIKQRNRSIYYIPEQARKGAAMVGTHMIDVVVDNTRKFEKLITDVKPKDSDHFNGGSSLSMSEGGAPSDLGKNAKGHVFERDEFSTVPKGAS